MKRVLSISFVLAALCTLMTVCAQAADYSFLTDGTPEYYASTSYADVYGTEYRYGGPNVVDYQIPESEYGQFTATQTGIMEKALLPGLQAQTAAVPDAGGYGLSDSGDSPVILPGVAAWNGSYGSVLPGLPSYTQLTDDFLLSNGAVGCVSIPAIGVKSFYLWEGETTSSMSKGLGHFSGTSVWNGNVGLCGHNRGSTYVIGAIKSLSKGDKVIYTTSQGTRTYKVETVTTISSTDWSYLEPTTDNRITMITCVSGDYSRRWCVQAVEAE